MGFAAKYLNPFTDFGFERLFGQESNQDLLIDFINSVLQGEQVIVSLKLSNNQPLAHLGQERIFELDCTNEHGEGFIVELHKPKPTRFGDHSRYRAALPRRSQSKEQPNLSAIYSIAMLDFMFDEQPHNPNQLLRKVKLVNADSQSSFFDNLTFIYLELPKFNKTPEQLSSPLDHWLYALCNLSRLDHYPPLLPEQQFRKLFEQAEIARLSPQQRRHYEASLAGS